MTISYTPEGVCSKKMFVSVEDGIITDAEIIGGCSGNTQAVSRLVIGMKVEDAISRLRGIKCGIKGTSCPDQLSVAMNQLLDATGNSKV